MAHQTEIVVNGQTVEVTEFDHTAQEIDDAVDRTGEDIPTSTTDPTSLSSQLSNKLGMPTEIEAGQDLNNYVVPGLYFCSEFAQSVDNIPPDSITGAFSLFVEKTGAYGNGVKQTFTEHNPGLTYIRLMSDTSMSHWSDWKPIATATPPQEYNLPLAEGITAAPAAIYYKTQDSIVHVEIMVSGEFAGETAVAVLPVGFRPKRTIRSTPHCWLTPQISGSGSVTTDGNIAVAFPSTVGHCSFNATFEAAEN